MIELEDVPELRDPVLIAAFEGWNDAGEAATSAVEHLATVWDAEADRGARPGGLLRLPGQPAAGRRSTTAGAGSAGRTTRILAARRRRASTATSSSSQGIEPSIRWRAFTIELLEFAERLGVTTFVTLGALLADVPHTRPIPVTATVRRRGRAPPLDLEPSALRGPDRHRRGARRRRHPGRAAVALVLGGRPPLRRAARPRPRRRSACSASSRSCST